MKKVITGLLVLLCISALTGCGKDDVTLAITSPSNIFIMRAGFRDKEVLSVEPSYTLRGDRIVGVLTIRIDCDTPLKSM